ncbi:uncharacterized protein H6S33_006547 [Morchella sextelata]|uniref:uncharacterized protein n=1 Tax=Morchella sextelata TaxID=1174677 RepID=UPI001D03A5F8|nr:uncharacterized protein H6S33_006547 [Morchella sextelata]KAH0604879.1 hypothetical protein H6S33_006547 [Morchella sextelata]
MTEAQEHPPAVLTSLWYLPEPSTFPPTAREVFKKHTNLADDEIIPHVISVRDTALKIFPYPCIGSFRFLDFSISESSAYDEIVSRLKSGEKLLDLGCCFGQDIRKLISDGAPSGNIYGSDLQAEFIGMGYDLFMDKDKIETKFIAPADIFDESEASPLNSLDGQMDIIHIGSFLHLFTLEDQVRAAKRIARMLSPKKGSMVVGRQGGSSIPGEFDHSVHMLEGKMYRHDMETFNNFWNKEVGGEWQVDGTFTPIELPKQAEGREGAGWLRFTVRRI